MIVSENVELKKYTTIKLGGIANRFYTPETEQELIDLIREQKPKYYIGGGSNLLIDEGSFDKVVNLREFNKEIEKGENGEFLVGASVRLQVLINFINETGYGGIEYLYSVPGLIGGAVVMNAGRGRNYGKCISDYIVAVKIFRHDTITWMTNEECCFSYRDSLLKRENIMVLAVKMRFDAMNQTESSKLKKERIELCKNVQDNSFPNFGSVFCESNAFIMKLMKTKLFGKKGKIKFSSKTANWILNCGGTFNDVMALIKRVEAFHKVIRKKCKREVVIWKNT